MAMEGAMTRGYWQKVSTRKKMDKIELTLIIGLCLTTAIYHAREYWRSEGQRQSRHSSM